MILSHTSVYQESRSSRLHHSLTISIHVNIAVDARGQDISGWAENDRGVSFIFGPDIVASFLQKQAPRLSRAVLDSGRFPMGHPKGLARAMVRECSCPAPELAPAHSGYEIVQFSIFLA